MSSGGDGTGRGRGKLNRGGRHSNFSRNGGLIGNAQSLAGWANAGPVRDDSNFVAVGDTDVTISVSSSTTPVGIPGLCQDQWSSFHNLLSSIKSSSLTFDTLSGKMHNSWILDTDCSHHMTN